MDQDGAPPQAPEEDNHNICNNHVNHNSQLHHQYPHIQYHKHLWL